MNKSGKNRIIVIIGVLTILWGIWSAFLSIPLVTLLESINKGGIQYFDIVHIETVLPNSPAFEAGLQTGDVIVSINEHSISDAEEFVKRTKEESGKEIKLVIERNSERKNIFVTPRKDPPPGTGPLGIKISYTFLPNPTYVLIPKILFRAYTGRDEKMTLFGTVGYQDRFYLRFQSLILGMLSIVIGTGILKLRRWSIPGYIFLTIYTFILRIVYFFLPQAPSNKLDSLNFGIFIILLLINISIIFYLIQQKKLFT